LYNTVVEKEQLLKSCSWFFIFNNVTKFETKLKILKMFLFIYNIY